MEYTLKINGVSGILGIQHFYWLRLLHAIIVRSA